MRRRKLLVALAGLAVATAAMLWPRTDCVTKENYFRIAVGMSRVELEAILGPPGDYRTGLGEEDWVYGALRQHRDPQRFTGALPAQGGSVQAGWLDISMSDSERGQEAHWVSDSVHIYVITDRGRLKYSNVYNRRTTQDVLERIRWRAERLWHRCFPE